MALAQGATTIDTDFAPETHTVGSSSVQSGVITTGSGLIRISTTTHCHIKFGANPTATEEDLMLPANHVEIFSFVSCLTHWLYGNGNFWINSLSTCM